MKGKENLVRCAVRHPLVESLCILFLLVAVTMSTAQTSISEPSEQLKIIYVYAGADGLNIGTSWANAINSLQDALLLAYFYEKPVEIRVAQGIYTPDRGIGIMPGDRTASFQLINGVTIKGGYAGYGEDDPNTRDIDLYETILSGDLYGNDPDVSSDYWWEESSSPQMFSLRAENSFHVVRGYGNSVIDGFTITFGNAHDPSRSLYGRSGGGLLISDWDTIIQIKITNCTFTGNSASSSGGGIYAFHCDLFLTNCTFKRNLIVPDGGSGAGIYKYYSNLSLTNCTFIENSTRYGEGGGIYNEASGPRLVTSGPSLVNCTFIENSARAGGGLYNTISNPTLINCVFRGNSVSEQGGGMCNISKGLGGDSPILRNCLFNRNHSGFRGGGIYNLSCEPVLTNCTFAENWAGEGNALYCRSELEQNTVTLTNCILWDFGTEIETRNNGLSIINVSYSNIRGGWFGEGNIDINPLFADTNNGDYHLKSQAGRWDPVGQAWIQDDVTSLCIDAGDPRLDWSAEPQPNGGRINMGAYGGTLEASLSLAAN